MKVLSKILLVDDNLQNIQVLGNLLENEGYQTEFALSGKEALHWIEESVFDLILLDVMMPGMNGFEVCGEIRKNSDYQDVPIVFLTAKTDIYSTLKGFDVKAQDYISKPFEQNELLARIKTQIELKQSKDLLKSMNYVLEEKVRERTKDLIQAHQKLEATNQELENANQELRQLGEAKNKFLHLISHEMRTPLNGLIGSTEILKCLVKDNDLMVSVGVLDESVKRLQRFSLDAILLTTLSVSGYRLEYEQVNVKDVLDVVITKHKKTYSSKKIEFINDNILSATFLTTDKKLIFEVLDRVIENSIVFSGETPVVKISKEPVEDHFVLTITDNGPGFPIEMLNRNVPLLSPVNHIDQNIGLDLYLVNLIMETLKGSLKIGNVKEGGACVTLCI